MARTDGTMNTHAFLPPSGAPYWRYCSLWPTMNARFPKESGAESLEGDAAHWCNVQPEPPALGMRAPNDVGITADMLKGRELWHSVCNRKANYDADEAHVSGKSIHATSNDGTPDRVEIDAGCLTVLDYKFGFGQVDAFENWQLINYAALILESLGLNDLQWSIRFVIVQPRGYHRDGPVRTWELPQAALLRGYWNQLRAAAAEATTPERVRGTVGPQCKHCSGRHACDALLRNTLVSEDLAGSSVPLDLSPAAVGDEWRRLRRARKLMEARETGLAEQAKAMMMQGQRVPHVALEESSGHARWKLQPDQVIAIGRTLGLDLSTQEVLTPAQARQLGMPADIVASLAYVPRGELRIVEDDGAALRKLFGK